METIKVGDYVRIVESAWVTADSLSFGDIGEVVCLEPDMRFPVEVVFKDESIEAFRHNELERLTDEEVMLWKLSN